MAVRVHTVLTRWCKEPNGATGRTDQLTRGWMVGGGCHGDDGLQPDPSEPDGVNGGAGELDLERHLRADQRSERGAARKRNLAIGHVPGDGDRIADPEA